jgi:hypothetical protein
VEKGEKNNQTPQTRTCQVGKIYPVNVIGSDHETDSDAQGAEKKRDEEGKAEI